jgi:hypothetical protein
MERNAQRQEGRGLLCSARAKPIMALCLYLSTGRSFLCTLRVIVRRERMFLFMVCSMSMKRDSPEPRACHSTRYQKSTLASKIMRNVKHVHGTRPVRGPVARRCQVQGHERASHYSSKPSLPLTIQVSLSTSLCICVGTHGKGIFMPIAPLGLCVSDHRE